MEIASFNIADFAQINPWLLALIVVWSLIWKGLALWHSARGNQKGWFIAILVINTVGLLEIIYLAFFRPKQRNLHPYLF
jgi:hypothetical protein